MLIEKNQIYLVTSILILIVLCCFAPSRAMAASVNNNYDLKTHTDVNPSLTFFTPGQGCTAEIWENYNFELAADSVSFVERLGALSEGDIYLASVAGDKTITYTLDKLERGNRIATDTGYFVEGMYEYSYKRVYGIEDFSKHNIILFQSDMPAERHNYVYNQFEFLVNGLYNEYDYNLGITPKINLIGHSRGGIINLMYATRHPYNVSNLFSLGTPYNGSRLGKITSLASLLGLEESLNCPSGQDIQDNRIQSTLKNEWNKMLIDHPDANINAIAFQSCTTLDLIKNILNSGELEAYFNNENDAKLQNFLIKFITNLTTKAIDKINSNPKFYTAVIKSAAELGIDFASIGAEPLEKDELEAAKEVFDNT